MLLRRVASVLLSAVLLCGMIVWAPQAQAHSRHHGHSYRGYSSRHYQNAYYDRRRQGWVDYKTGKILKGGLVGAGIGAGAGLLLDRNVGKSALIGAGLGAGTQAVRYSRTMHRHPVAKTTAYGALAGVGVSAATRKSLGKGALWGAGAGAALGALSHLD